MYIYLAKGFFEQVTVFGGPSYIRVQQDLVTDVRYSESYPYDTATFASATTASVQKGGVGFNVGADATWKLGRSLRAGGLVRYSRADLTLSSASGNDVALRTGGMQVAGTLQFILRR